MQLNDAILIWIGGLAVLIAGSLVKQWFTKFVNKKFDDLQTFQMRSEKEREQDNYLSIRGQQVVADNLHELNYAVLHGTHNGTLEKTNKELDEYRALLNKTIDEKAARWNLRIDHS